MGPADTWQRMAAWLGGLIDTLPARPKAIVVISGHWEEHAFTVTSGAQPALIYDYYGFPAHTYQLSYPVAGESALAQRIQSLLSHAALPTTADAGRGFDHGVFIPFKLIVPEADIPIVQLSLQKNLDPSQHLAAGRALAPLRQEGVLLVGSGMSYHNMRGFGDQFKSVSDTFDDWLSQACESAPATRNRLLAEWERAPAARASHPREEHLLPLMVVAGAAETDPGQKIFTDCVLGVTVSAFQFG